MKSKLPAPTAKEINEAHRLAMSSAKSAVEHAIRCGQMLIRMQGELDRGQIRPWVEKRTEVAWSTAQRYMSAARKNAQGIAFESLRHCFPSGAQAKPKNPKKRAPTAAPATESPTAVGDSGAPAAAPAAFPDSGSSKIDEKTTGTAAPAAFPKPAEVAPAPDFDFTDYEPENDDAYKANVENVMMADDKLVAMREELKQVHREMQGLKASRDHYQSEAGTAVRLVKARDREIEKLKKDLAKAREENEALRERVAIMEQAA